MLTRRPTPATTLRFFDGPIARLVYNLLDPPRLGRRGVSCFLTGVYIPCDCDSSRSCLAVTAARPVAVRPGQEGRASTARSRQASSSALIQDFVKARREADVPPCSRRRRTRRRRRRRPKLPKEADFLPRIHRLIAGGAKDEVAAEALAFAVFGLQTKDEKVFDALSMHFVKTDRIRRFVQMAMSGAPGAGQAGARNGPGQNPSKDLKGQAVLRPGVDCFEKEGEGRQGGGGLLRSRRKRVRRREGRTQTRRSGKWPRGACSSCDTSRLG